MYHKHVHEKADDKKVSHKLSKGIGWAIGVIVAAVLALVGTNVVPAVVGQFVNGAQVEDRFRGGPDIITSENLFYPDGSGVPLPTVAIGNYQPSNELAHALAHPMAVTSPSVESKIRSAVRVDVQDIWIRVILQGNRNQKLLILNIHPVQVHRAPPLNGVLFDIYGQGGSPTIRMGFNLDQPLPQAVDAYDGRLSERPYFKSHTISLAEGEQSVVVVDAETKCYNVHFKLAVDYLVGGTNKQVIISNHGKPFKVTAYRYNDYNVMSYKHIFALNPNFSATQPSPSELARVYRRTAQEAQSCPS